MQTTRSNMSLGISTWVIFNSKKKLLLFFMVVACVVQSVIAEDIFQNQQTTETTFWTTGNALMPAWGFYPNSSSYGDTKPLGGCSAWTGGTKKTHVLTWVADFPASGVYHVWVRQYGGYGKISVLVDENSLGHCIERNGIARYVWYPQGKQMISMGKHHVDIVVSNGMFDAILFTTDADYNPEKGYLPQLEKEPVLRGFRKYRDDSNLHSLSGEKRYVVGRVPLYADIIYDWLPNTDELISSLTLWGASNQYISGSFCIRAFENIDELELSLPELVGPLNTKLYKNAIDIKVVYVRSRLIELYKKSRSDTMVPELLVRDNRTELPPKGKQGGFGGGCCTANIPGHESRQCLLTVHIPEGAPPGIYKGNLSLNVSGSANRSNSLPVEISVFALDLKGAEGYYSIFYPNRPDGTDAKHHVTVDRYLSELKDQVRHGLNTTSLYGRFGTMAYAKEAGMTKPPCLMVWPDSRAFNWIDMAKKNGLGGLLYYGIDEPRTPEKIGKCVKEAQRRQKLGLSMLTAINSREAQLATRDVIDYPVYNIYVFSGRDNEVVMYARKKGFNPVSYWLTSTPFPLYYRALTGLYNKACGYEGSMPWSYQDVSDKKLYDTDTSMNKVTYPDEFGEPISTLSWEAYRDGIDDVRYLEALDRAIAKSQRRLDSSDAPAELAIAVKDAREVRRRYFENIQGRWFEYLCDLQPGDLETARRAFADAIIAMNLLMDKG